MPTDLTPVNLAVGEPDFPTPDHIKEAAYRAIAENWTKYTPQPGFQDLREAIVRKFRDENGVPASPDQIVVSCGAKHSLYNVMQAALRAGDEVIVHAPHWYAYPEQVKLAGATPVLVETPEKSGFQPDTAAIRAAVTRATRMIVLNSPCNPTGVVFERNVLEEIARLAVERNLLVVSDEVYEKILFDGARHYSMASLGPEIAARTITINSVSKTHAMTGWRIGYAAMPVELAQRVTRLQSLSTSGPCAISQRAALAAFVGSQSHVPVMVAEYLKRRDYLVGRLATIPALRCFRPAGTFYLFINMAALIGRAFRGATVRDASHFADLLRTEMAVNLSGGRDFGSQVHLRLSFATSMDALKEGMDRVEEFISS